jgi:hypothetical protein
MLTFDQLQDANPLRTPAGPDNAVGDTGVMDRPVHPDIEPLVFLLGTWNGEGRGEYPTISRFGYRETVVFTHVGKPFVAYAQRTFANDDGRPLHGEAGFLRLPRPGWVELVVAHPTGVVEVEEGPFSGSSLRLRSSLVAGTGSAKEVTAIERDFDFEEGVIRYSLRMAAVGRPLAHHLEARLRLEGS